jgi:hypothetical protein
MKTLSRLIFLIFGIIFCLSGYAQQPRLTNTQVTSRSAAAGLEREFRALVAGQAAAAWVGYAVPIIPGEHNMCCNDGCCGGCRLEERGSGSVRSSVNSTVRLEGGRNLFVLFRVEQGQVQKIRTFSEDCELDAGGLPFFWLNDVRPPESVALLASYAKPQSEEKAEKKLGDSAVAAIAFHKDPSADRVLEQFTASSQPESLRERVSFWLGVARGRPGYEILRRMIKEDPSERVREKVIFALSQSKEPEALNAMIETARGDSSAHVRGQALFWLAQKAGKKAEEAITAAIENDPETDVKKKAVFALSQLPKDEGVPKLIQVAKTNKNPAVRKQAMFWLGQSKDSRALAFFEEILSR